MGWSCGGGDDKNDKRQKRDGGGRVDGRKRKVRWKRRTNEMHGLEHFARRDKAIAGGGVARVVFEQRTMRGDQQRRRYSSRVKEWMDERMERRRISLIRASSRDDEDKEMEETMTMNE